ncbi:MAG: hypothetical protein FJ291_06970 [Planctomycetes bacterium]|nr:hypothetical protein [Planctomycetota bacterium]
MGRLEAVMLATMLIADGCASGADDRLAAIRAAMQKLRPLATKLGPPRLGDWLAHHKEPGQTFEEYLASNPTGLTKERRTLYVQPLACCPECVAKLWWATGAQPVPRYRTLAEFCKEQGLAPEQEFYEKCVVALEKR